MRTKINENYRIPKLRYQLMSEKEQAGEISQVVSLTHAYRNTTTITHHRCNSFSGNRKCQSHSFGKNFKRINPLKFSIWNKFSKNRAWIERDLRTLEINSNRSQTSTSKNSSTTMACTLGIICSSFRTFGLGESHRLWCFQWVVCHWFIRSHYQGPTPSFPFVCKKI